MVLTSVCDELVGSCKESKLELVSVVIDAT